MATYASPQVLKMWSALKREGGTAPMRRMLITGGVVIPPGIAWRYVERRRKWTSAKHNKGLVKPRKRPRSLDGLIATGRYAMMYDHVRQLIRGGKLARYKNAHGEDMLFITDYGWMHPPIGRPQHG